MRHAALAPATIEVQHGKAIVRMFRAKPMQRLASGDPGYIVVNSRALWGHAIQTTKGYLFTADEVLTARLAG